MLRSRKFQRLGFFVVASVALFYVFTVLFPDKSDEISQNDFSGFPPTNRFVSRRKKLKLENVKGFFMQDLMETEDTFNVLQVKDFGLIPQTYSIINKLSPNSTQWEYFRMEMERMNEEVTVGRLGIRGYKVLYLFRPPESWHQIGEQFYGRERWECRWTREDGNGTVEWVDAELTPDGLEGARHLNKLWKNYLGDSRLAMPELFLSSPLSRAAETLQSAFDLTSSKPLPTAPIFVEYLRESFGIDTHNSRRSYTYLQHQFPYLYFEDEFKEDDELWVSHKDEHEESVRHRANIFLDNLFLRREETYIAVSTHETIIKAILEAIGHRQFVVPVGHMIPVVVKASWAKTYEPRTEYQKYKTFYKRDRNCTDFDPVTDPDAEPEEEVEEYEL